MRGRPRSKLLRRAATSDILRSKLEAVLQESRAQQAQSLNELDVLGARREHRDGAADVRAAAELQQVVALCKAAPSNEASSGGAKSSSTDGRWRTRLMSKSSAVEGTGFWCATSWVMPTSATRCVFVAAALRILGATAAWRLRSRRSALRCITPGVNLVLLSALDV